MLKGENAENAFRNIDDMRALERFFYKTWTGILRQQHVRIGFISIFVIAFVVGSVLAGTRVRVTKQSPAEAFFRKSHPLQTVLDIAVGENPVFKAADDEFKQLGHWVYGLDNKTPIDRSGTDPLGVGPEGKDIQFEDSTGVTRYNGQDLTSPSFQEKMIEDCATIENLPSVYRVDGDSPGQVFCFMRDFKKYMQVYLCLGIEDFVTPATMSHHVHVCTHALSSSSFPSAGTR